ncbi:thioredoxin family protein [Chitinophagales bacterium]|nr:thioredoxin family protein [Chitinophagales bacterium]
MTNSRYYYFYALLGSILLSFCFGFITVPRQQIEWLSVEEAIVAHEKSPKKWFISLGAVWCQPCKQMSSTTLKDYNLSKYVTDKFYAVKLDAESRDTFLLAGEKYEYTTALGRNGVNTLALYLANGRSYYPTTVVLDEYLSNPQALYGFQSVESLEPFLVYFGENYHERLEWSIFENFYERQKANNRAWQ